jgi:molecular chaperone GrpE (heat shock protein)
MAHHNPSSMSEDGLVSATQPIATEAAERSEQLQVQLKTSERLNEYYNQVVAEIRASLERIEEEDRAKAS